MIRTLKAHKWRFAQAALAALILAALLRDGSAGAPSMRSGPAAATSLDGLDEDPLPNGPTVKALPATGRRPITDNEPVEATTDMIDPIDQPDATVEITGRLVVTSASSAVPPPPSGFVIFDVDGEPVVVRVTQGTWALNADVGAEFLAATISLGGHTFKCGPFPFTASPELGLLELKVVIPSADQLEVIDGLTGARLEGVTLCVAQNMSDSFLRSPTTAALSSPVVIAGASPLAFPSLTGTNHFWVGKDGYAWKSLAYRAHQGDRTVALLPGGDAHLVVTEHEATNSRIGLRVDSASGRRIASLSIVDGSADITGLEVGEYLATLSHPLGKDALPSLTAPFSVRVGEVTNVTLNGAHWDDRRFGALEISMEGLVQEELGSDYYAIAERTSDDGVRLTHSIPAIEFSPAPNGLHRARRGLARAGQLDRPNVAVLRPSVPRCTDPRGRPRSYRRQHPENDTLDGLANEHRRHDRARCTECCLAADECQSNMELGSTGCRDWGLDGQRYSGPCRYRGACNGLSTPHPARGVQRGRGGGDRRTGRDTRC